MSHSAPLVSLIIRTKNEERWIGSCLRAVMRQTYPNFEIILVDNQSTDQTVAKARQFPITLVEIEKFLPGKALNDGIRASRGEILVCLSGHCIPTNDTWLANLVKDLADPQVAGVYGRQEPLSFSSPLDKRDLMITFGLDRRVQTRDSFFHNANSALRRDTWDRFPFDEEVTNIEDRLWGHQVLSAGMKIVYEPEASVYHWHGIHQDLNAERARNVVRIMEQIQGLTVQSNGHDIDEMNIVAIIPTRGKPKRCGDKALIEYTVADALAARHLDRVYVATDDPETAALVEAMGASVLMRPAFLSEDYVDVVEVMQWTLQQIEDGGQVPDLVVALEETHPFRPSGLVDDMVEQLVRDGLDSVVAAKAEPRRLWLSEGGTTRDLGEPAFMPRKFKDSIAHVGLFGLACVTHPQFLRDSSVLGAKAAIYEVKDPFCAVEIRDEQTLAVGGRLLEFWAEGRQR